MTSDSILQSVEQFRNDELDIPSRIETGKVLLSEIRSSGRHITGSLEREKYAQIAREISDTLYDLTGELLPTRLEVPDYPSGQSFVTQTTIKNVFSYALIAITYIGIGVLGFLYTRTSSAATADIMIAGIPSSILFWGAIGGAAAVLYRVYSGDAPNSSLNIYWYSLRPIIGAVMGAFMYLVVASGQLLLSNQAVNVLLEDPARTILWALAFLLGFSDRFLSALSILIIDPNAKKNIKS